MIQINDTQILSFNTLRFNVHFNRNVTENKL
jgi:hypothetical protein